MNSWFGLIGKNGAGKSEACSCLSDLGYRVISLSDFVREACQDAGMAPTRENLIKMANFLKEKYGDSVLAHRAYDAVKRFDKVVFDSIRNVSEVEFLQEKGVVFFGIDAPVELRYERISSRNKETDHVDFETFKRLDDLESSGESSGQHINAALEKCVLIIQNNKDKAHLNDVLQFALKGHSCA